jgi:hypothetical protein
MKLAKRIGMRKAKVAIARKIAVILTASGSMAHPSTGGSRSQSDICSQAPGPIYRTGNVPLGRCRGDLVHSAGGRFDRTPLQTLRRPARTSS